MAEIGGKTKRTLLYVNVGVYGMLTAVEYSVVLPTLWLYLNTAFGSASWYFGLCLSAFHLSSLIFAPLFGWVNDRGIKTKSLVMFANVFQIVGSIMYLIRSEWLVFLARFVAGVGSAVGSLLYADVNRVTAASDRTSVLAVLLLCRQVGLFVGPALNFFLTHFNFRIGPLLIDPFTAPGFLMAILWLLFQAVMGLSYYNVDQLGEEEEEEEEKEEGETSSDGRASPRDPLLQPTPANSGMIRNYGSVGNNNNNATNNHRDYHATKPPPHESSPSPRPASPLPPPRLSFFTSESIVVLLAVFFISYFAQMTLETMVTPITQKFFQYGELENACLYAAAGGVVFVVCIVVSLIGKRCGDADRAMTLLGLVCMTICTIWAAVVLPSGDAYGRDSLWWHCFGSIFVDLVGLTVVAIAAMSLYSKLVDDAAQGFGMGVRRAVVSLALIMGPLWGGPLIDRLRLMFFVLTGLLSLNVVMFVASYSRLRPSSPVGDADRNEAV